jgi:hypothetical protein
MTKSEIDRKIDTGFERIAEDLDSVAIKYGLTNEQMTAFVRDWDFPEYYEEWMREGWDG